MYGITGRDNSADVLSTCFREADLFDLNMTSAAEMITNRSYAGLVDGTELVMQSLRNLSENLNECSEATDDVKAIEEWVSSNLNEDQTMKYNVQNNFGQLSLEIAKTKVYLAGHHYFSLGESMGNLMTLLTEPAQVMYLN